MEQIYICKLKYIYSAFTCYEYFIRYTYLLQTSCILTADIFRLLMETQRQQMSYYLFTGLVPEDGSCQPNIYVSWSTLEFSIRFVPFKPSLFSYRQFQDGASFVDLICYLSLPYCHICFFQPWWHLLGKGWRLGFLECDVFLCFCHFPIRCP